MKALKFVEKLETGDISFREFEALRSLLSEKTSIKDLCDELRPLMGIQASRVKEIAESGNVKDIVPAWSKLDSLSLWYERCMGL